MTLQALTTVMVWKSTSQLETFRIIDPRAEPQVNLPTSLQYLSFGKAFNQSLEKAPWQRFFKRRCG